MANVTDRVAQIRGARHGRDVRESFATCIEDMNTEVETATGNYAKAQSAADKALTEAKPAAEAANAAAQKSNAAAESANTAANNANEKASNLISTTTLAELGLSADSTPDDALSAIISLLAGKVSANTDNPIPVNLGGTGGGDIASVRDAWGLGDTDGPLPVQNGGTGASSAAQALSNLGAAPATHYHAGKVLVSGADWQMGISKKIVDIGKYNIFRVNLTNTNVPLIGIKSGASLIATGAYCTETNGQRIYTAYFKINGTTVTLQDTSGITHNSDGGHSAWTGYGVSYLVGIC